MNLAHSWSKVKSIFTKLLCFPGTFTARLAMNSLFGERWMKVVSREAVLQDESYVIWDHIFTWAICLLLDGKQYFTLPVFAVAVV